jgi:ABC-type nitrate/sulfonate/bicarbonate transport system substrate-binding protein
MTRQRGRLSAGVIVISFIVAACTGPGAPTARPPTAATPTRAPATATAPAATATAMAMTDVKIQLDFQLSGYMPLLWGQDKGFFESRGLNPDFIVSGGSDDALTAINTGAVDFAFLDGSNYIESRIKGESETTAIYVWYPISTTGIISTEQITEPEDMIGKTFGTVPFSSGKDKIPAILQANGVDYPGPNEPDTDVVLMDFQILYSQLFSGDIDTAEAGLAGSWENARASAAEQEPPVEVFFIPISEWGYKDYSKLLIATDEIIQSDPDLVSRVVAAVWESETDALANATGAQMYDLLLAADPQAEEVPTLSTWESVQTYMKNPGPIDPTVFDYQLQFLADQGTTTDLTSADLYTNEFIPADAPLPSPSAT